MRLWLIMALWLSVPDRLSSFDALWQPAALAPNGAASQAGLMPVFLPLVKRANGEVRLKPISFNTF
jgi:hypothetical protein